MAWIKLRTRKGVMFPSKSIKGFARAAKSEYKKGKITIASRLSKQKTLKPVSSDEAKLVSQQDWFKEMKAKK